MELALSLGDTVVPIKRFSILEKSPGPGQLDQMVSDVDDKDVCMAIGKKSRSYNTSKSDSRGSSSSDHHHHPPVQLDLLLPCLSSSTPLTSQTSPLPHHLSFSWLTRHNLSGGLGCSENNIGKGKRCVDNLMRSRRPLGLALGVLENLQLQQQQDLESKNHELIILERGGSRRASSDEEEEEILMAMGRKKLRLTKDQSAFLEDSFKDHSTLNPKQKMALAKQLKLRPRQVEVWFQNRRARTKLKQTEVDCEYLKRYCEKLTEENRKLQKEVQELRALKQSSSQPFCMQLPPTTLTMCPSCVATTSNVATNTQPPSATTVFLEAKPIRSIPFSPTLAS